MKGFVIVNMNYQEDYQDHVYYIYDQGPSKAKIYYLHGLFVSDTTGSATNVLNKAKVYDDRKKAEKQRAKLEERFKVGGDHFVGTNRDGGGSRYPDSVGKQGYKIYAPKYEVREVSLSIMLDQPLK